MNTASVLIPSALLPKPQTQPQTKAQRNKAPRPEDFACSEYRKRGLRPFSTYRELGEQRDALKGGLDKALRYACPFGRVPMGGADAEQAKLEWVFLQHRDGRWIAHHSVSGEFDRMVRLLDREHKTFCHDTKVVPGDAAWRLLVAGEPAQYLGRAGVEMGV